MKQMTEAEAAALIREDEQKGRARLSSIETNVAYIAEWIDDIFGPTSRTSITKVTFETGYTSKQIQAAARLKPSVLSVESKGRCKYVTLGPDAQSFITRLQAERR